MKECDCLKQFKDSIMDYTFYDEQHNLVLCLNEDKIKEIFGVDKVIFQEDFGYKRK